MESRALADAYSLALDHLDEVGIDADHLRDLVDLEVAVSGETIDRLSDDQKRRIAAVALAHVVTDHPEQIFNDGPMVEVFVTGVGRSSDVGPTVTYGLLVQGDDGDELDEQVTVEIATRDARLAAEIDLLIEELRPQPKPFLSARTFDQDRARLLRRPCTREYVRLRRALVGSRVGSQGSGSHRRLRRRERQTRRSSRSARGTPSRDRDDDDPHDRLARAEGGLLRLLVPPSLRATIFCRLPLPVQDVLLWNRIRRDLDRNRAA